MRKWLSSIIILTLVMTALVGCGSKEEESTQKSTVEVQRGDIIVSITSDGNLVMPHEVKLRFGTPGTVQEILVDEGQVVKAGTLLAKLDDTSQKIAIESAQYDLQLAMNDLAVTVPGCCQILGYPRRYPNASALRSYEQAQKETEDALELLKQGNYKEAVSRLRISQYDIDATIVLFEAPITDTETYPDVAGIIHYAEDDPDAQEYVQTYPKIREAVDRLKQDKESLENVQALMEDGNYSEASSVLKKIQQAMVETHRIVKSVSGQIVRHSVSYPDTATSADYIEAVEEALEKLQKLMEQGDYDPVEFAQTLRMAQHDLGISRYILDNNEVIFENGLTLKDTQQYNLSIHKAELALQNYKEELMKTEILAPFDGTVVDINVKENDQLSSFDYSSTTAVHLVDTGEVEMNGVVDEIDIYKVKVGQKAIIIIDAMPDVELTGTVTFISPFGTEETGIVNFAITILLDPSEIELRGGLTATADIIADEYENVLLIPNNAIKGTHGDYLVEIILDETTGETEERQIVLGVQNEHYSEIISGLEEGEKVVVETPRTKSTLFK